MAGTTDRPMPMKAVEEALKYIADTPEIRDVLISGGDSLLVENDRLEYLFSRLRQVPHVEIIRFGTRTPVVLPQRITPELCTLLKRFHPIWVNTHFNHPKEITAEAKNACALLADAGIPLGNQTVFQEIL